MPSICTFLPGFSSSEYRRAFLGDRFRFFYQPRPIRVAAWYISPKLRVYLAVSFVLNAAGQIPKVVGDWLMIQILSCPLMFYGLTDLDYSVSVKSDSV